MQGQQFSAILPNQQQSPAETLAQLSQQLYARRQHEAALQKEQQDRADEWLRGAYGELDMKHFATGTALDPVISNSLNEAKKQLAQRIMNNPNVSSASMMYDLQNAVHDISQYSTKARAIRTNVENLAKEYGKNPSINAGKLFDNSMRKAFFKYDPANHQFTLKDPTEIDENYDYVTDYLNQYPEDVVIGSKALDNLLKGADKKVYKKETTVDRGGVRRVLGFEGEYFPQYNILVDDKGNEVTDANMTAKGVKVRSRKVKVGDELLDVADDNTYSYFTADPGANAWLNAHAKQLVNTYPELNPEVVKRRILYNYLHQNNQGYINNVKDVVDDSQLQTHNWALLAKAITANKVNGDVEWNNLYDGVHSQMAPGTTISINHLPDQFTRILMQTAKDIPVTEEAVTQNRVTIRKDLSGNMSLLVDGKPITQITKIGVNLKANTGQKQKAAALKDANQPMSNLTPQPSGKSISKEVFRKMSITDRQQFLSNGGNVQ